MNGVRARAQAALLPTAPTPTNTRGSVIVDAARLGKDAASGGKLMSASSKFAPSGRKRKRNKLAADREAANPAPKGLPRSLVLYGPSVPTRANHPSQPAYTGWCGDGRCIYADR